MNGTIAILIGVLVIWMLAVAWCGYGKRFFAFLGVLAVGLGLNGVWMVWGLDAKPFEKPVLVAQMAAITYAFCAFASGWLVGRVVRELRASRVVPNNEV